MRSRPHCLTSAFGAATGLAPVDAAASQKAALTTVQMREGGAGAKLTIQSLRKNLSLISGSGGNVLVLSGPDGKLVVDSGLATSKVQMAKALEAISPEPLRFLINTHWHFDHTDGNEWMHSAGATIFAQSKTLFRMGHKQIIPEFDGVFPPSPAGARPTVTFDRIKTLEVNRNEISLARYTPAHTETDISIFLVDADVLHTGDTLFSEFYPFIDYNSGGSIDGMIAACQESLALIGPSTLVVCGHGSAGSHMNLVAFRQMLIEVRSKVEKLKQAGFSAEDVIDQKPTASYDERWGHGFVSPDLFTWLVYRGV